MQKLEDGGSALRGAPKLRAPMVDPGDREMAGGASGNETAEQPAVEPAGDAVRRSRTGSGASGSGTLAFAGSSVRRPGKGGERVKDST